MPASFGKFYDIIDQGNTYVMSTAVGGTALPILTGTAGTFALWNTTSNLKAVLLRINIGFTSGTIALGEFGLGSLNAPTFSIATGGLLTAFADAAAGTVKNAKLGMADKPAMRCCVAATTTFTASTAFPWYYLGSSITAATGAQPVSVASHDLDGLVVMPGQLVFLGGTVAQTGLFSVSLMFAEVPI
jgi:hypothetical protein